MKTFKLTVTEEELGALISHHAVKMHGNYSTETSERIHTLTKRLNKETPDIEGDPRPQTTQETAAVEQAKIPEGW
jgi:hypothetical protein